MKNIFAMALETEMARLDDARVYGTHRHFMHFIARDPVKINPSDLGHRGITLLEKGPLYETQWLEPRMTLGLETELFRDFAFKKMNLGAAGRKRWKTWSPNLGFRDI